MTAQTNNNVIRPYGLGKFDTILDEYVYQVSLDGGPDEECGDSSSGAGWYGLMRDGKTIFRDNDPFLETLNEAEHSLLESSAGVILFEDTQGFVSVDYFEDAAELERIWAEIMADEDIEDEDSDEG